MFDLLAHKVNWVKRNLTSGLLSNLRTKLDQIISESCQHNSLPSAVHATLELDLLYCFLRNRRWLASDAFLDVVTDQVVSSFGLPNDSVEKIVTDFRTYLVQMQANPTATEETNSDFFRHLIIKKGSGTEIFCRETGFNDTLYEKIAANQKLVLDELEDPDNTKAHFLSEIDQQICSEIIEICEMTSDALDQLQLRHEIEQDLTLDDADITKIYEFLRNLCSAGFAKKTQLKESNLSEDHLTKTGLVQISRGRVMPTPRAYHCTARGFADSFWQASDPEFFRVPDFNAVYQRAIIRQVPLSRTEELAERIKPLLGKMTPSIYLDIAETLPESISLPLLTDVVSGAQSDWHRHFACQAISKIGRENQYVRQTLHNVAQSDDSDLVKDTALEQLARSAIFEPANGNTDT